MKFKNWRNYKKLIFIFLENIKIKGIKKLYLGHNKIENIEILGELSINKISTLDLNKNKIININILKNMSLNNLYTFN